MALDPYAKKPKLSLKRPGDPGWSSPGANALPTPGPAPAAPTGVGATLRDFASTTGLDQLNPVSAARDVINDPMGSAEKTLAPFVGGGSGLRNALVGANVGSQIVRSGLASRGVDPQRVNEIKGVVDRLPAVAEQGMSAGRKVLTGLGLAGSAGTAAVAAASQPDTPLTPEELAAAGMSDPSKTPASDPGATGASPAGLRSIVTGRDARGNLVAASDGTDPMQPSKGAQKGSPLRNLHTISFAPETQADRDKQAAASTQYYKNIGGDLASQYDQLSQNLSEQRAPGAYGVSGQRNAGLRSGQTDTPLDVAKFLHDTQTDAAKTEADRVNEQNRRTDAQAQAYLSRIDPKQAGEQDLGDAQLLAGYDRLKEKDPNLFSSNTPESAAVRENLQQRATDLLNQHFQRYTTDDPNQPIAPKVGSADLSGFGKGSYRGGVKALVPDFINDFGGSFTYTDPASGEKYAANADEFNPVQLELLRRAAELGPKDRAAKKGVREP
jgi:hypothetical protein